MPDIGFNLVSIMAKGNLHEQLQGDKQDNSSKNERERKMIHFVNIDYCSKRSANLLWQSEADRER